MKQFSVIIPIYNEELILSSSLEKLVTQLKKYSYKIILVENGSTDNTKITAEKLIQKHKTIRLLSIPGPNFGNAIRKGIEEATSEILFLFNIDWWDIEFIQTSLPLLEKYPIIVGSKLLNKNLDRRPFIRKLGSKLLTAALRGLFGFHGSDSHGIKAMRKSIAKPIIDTCISNEIIESELLIRSQHQGIAHVEIPLAISEIRPARIGFSVRMIKVFWELLRLKISFFYEHAR